MKTPTKVIFASALMLSVVAPSLSYAAYYVDQTKTWALETRAQDAMDKVTRHKRAQLKRKFQGNEALNFMARGNTSVPGVGIDKGRHDPEVQIIDATGSALARGAAIFFSHATPFRFCPPEQLQTRGCPLLALSGHTARGDRTCPLSGVKRTCVLRCTCLLLTQSGRRLCPKRTHPDAVATTNWDRSLRREHAGRTN